VIRGLADGRLRLTSITLTNEPAIDRCDAIAAEADPETTPVAGDMHTLTARLGALAAAQGNRNRNTDRRGNVDKLLKMIGQLLGRDAVALEADGDAPADVLAGIETLATEVAGLRTERAERVAFLGKARDALALEGEPSLDAVQGAIAGLAAKAGQADALRIRVDALALEGETRRKAEVVARLTSEGKLTRAMIENWVPGQDVAALEAYAQHAPRLVQVGERVGRDTLPAADALALTAEEIEVAKSCGLKPEEVLAEKKIRAGLTA
jgi:phage I-like protein